MSKIIYRTYKYLIKPNEYQESKIMLTFQCCTFVYNAYILECQKNGPRNIMAKLILEEYRNKNKFLTMADQSALMNVLFKLQDKGENARYLTIKKKNLSHYMTSNLYKRGGIFVNDDSINIPFIGTVKAVVYRKIPDNVRIMSATILKDKTNTYYCHISFCYAVEDNYKELDINKSIGLDYSSPYFYVDSNGNKSNMQHFYRISEEKLSNTRKQLSKCERNSKNYFKVKNRLSKMHKHVANQRHDFLHKLSTELSDKYDYICVEDLNIQKIANYHNLAKNTYDNSYANFIEMLNYKMEERNKKLIKVNRYYPSSKKCNVCGYINNDLLLSERTWICPKCSTLLDRDINAAKNILVEGLSMINK